MTGRIIIRPRAALDIAEQAAWYTIHASRDVSGRFLAAVTRSSERALGMPGMGAPRPQADPALSGLRMLAVDGFESHLIFYLPAGQGIELVRVLHGMRDIAAILAADPARNE
jgi:toxin ParE1/3/4